MHEDLLDINFGSEPKPLAHPLIELGFLLGKKTSQHFRAEGLIIREQIEEKLLLKGEEYNWLVEHRYNSCEPDGYSISDVYSTFKFVGHVSTSYHLNYYPDLFSKELKRVNTEHIETNWPEIKELLMVDPFFEKYTTSSFRFYFEDGMLRTHFYTEFFQRKDLQLYLEMHKMIIANLVLSK